MKKILFVCHGNICRSPMAEFVMKKLVADAGRAEEFVLASAATSAEEIGNDMYPPAKACLRAHGIPFSRRAARQVEPGDYAEWDLILLMDRANARNLRRIIPADPENKIRMLMSFAGETKDVADPWYTDDFETTYRDVLTACTALLASDA